MEVRLLWTYLMTKYNECMSPHVCNQKTDLSLCALKISFSQNWMQNLMFQYTTNINKDPFVWYSPEFMLKVKITDTGSQNPTSKVYLLAIYYLLLLLCVFVFLFSNSVLPGTRIIMLQWILNHKNSSLCFTLLKRVH